MGIEAPQEPWHTHTCRPQRDRRDGWQPSTDGTRDDRSDAAIGTCTVGEWVYYSGTYYSPTDPKKNTQAAYAGLLLALASGKKVEVHAEAAGCTVVNIHPTNQ